MIIFRRFLTILCITLIAWQYSYATDDSDDGDDDRPTNPTTAIAGPIFITLDDKTQKLAGIRTDSAKPYHYRAELTAYGKVVDITPLLTLRQQYLATLVRQDSATEKYRVSQKALSRLQNLHKEDVVSTRQLQQQQSQWQTDKALLDETTLQRRMIMITAAQQWGAMLTDWFTKPSSPEVDSIIKHESQLLQIILPGTDPLPQDTGIIEFSPTNQQQTSHARLIGAAPQIDPITQHRQYFFLATENDLPAGLQITARIPSKTDASAGVAIPRNALLWHLGQTFIFIKQGDDQFIRREVSNYREIPEGYFVASDIEVGQVVVTSGAQLLLSQQLRAQIPDEDDDD